MEKDEFRDGIVGYLISLGPKVLEELYQDPFTCSTVFRSLSSVAKQYLVRLCLLPRPSPKEPLRIPLPIINAWTKSSPMAIQIHTDALKRLSSLRILVQSGDSLTLNLFFQDSLLKSLGDTPESSLETLEQPSKDPPTPEEITQSSQTKWEQILSYLVLPKGPKPPKAIHQLLTSLQLLSTDTSHSGAIDGDGSGAISFSGAITPKGYRFLFSDLHTQLWLILVGYLDNLGRQNLDRGQVLRFMFRLGFLVPNQHYSKKGLSPAQRIVVQDLVRIGILYHKKENSSRFYPTPLALSLSSSSSSSSSALLSSKGFIVVETTFKVYAYTSSRVQSTLLKLFLQVQFSLPGLLVGKLTKQSVKRALDCGVGAEEMAQFLVHNAHQVCGHKVPANVLDQLRLWEAERNRLVQTPSACLSHFSSIEEFRACLSFAEQHSCVVYVSEERLEVYVTLQGLALIREHVEEWRP